MSSPLSHMRKFTWRRTSTGISGNLFNAPLRTRVLLGGRAAGLSSVVPSVWSETRFRLVRLTGRAINIIDTSGYVELRDISLRKKYNRSNVVNIGRRVDLDEVYTRSQKGRLR